MKFISGIKISRDNWFLLKLRRVKIIKVIVIKIIEIFVNIEFRLNFVYID